jgi:membrane-associated phospholipid phosphatase
VTIAFIGWRWFSRPVALLLTLEAAGVVMSTVYTQNHYAIDSLAGIVWALALQGLMVPFFKLWLQPMKREPRPVPQLPVFRPAADTTGGGT